MGTKVVSSKLDKLIEDSRYIYLEQKEDDEEEYSESTWKLCRDFLHRLYTKNDSIPLPSSIFGGPDDAFDILWKGDTRLLISIYPDGEIDVYAHRDIGQSLSYRGDVWMSQKSLIKIWDWKKKDGEFVSEEKNKENRKWTE